MKRFFFRFVTLPLLLFITSYWFGCSKEQEITGPADPISFSTSLENLNLPQNESLELKNFLRGSTQKTGRELTIKEENLLTEIFLTVQKINNEIPALKLRTGKKYLPISISAEPSSGDKQNKIIFNSVGEAKEFINRTFPLEEVHEKIVGPKIRNDQWIGEGDLKYGSINASLTFVQPDDGVVAQYNMPTQFWYAFGKQKGIFPFVSGGTYKPGYTSTMESEYISPNGSSVATHVRTYSISAKFDILWFSIELGSTSGTLGGAIPLPRD